MPKYIGFLLNRNIPVVTKRLAFSGDTGLTVVLALRKLTIAVTSISTPSANSVIEIVCCAGKINFHELVKLAISHMIDTQMSKTIGGGIFVFMGATILRVSGVLTLPYTEKI